MSANPHLSEKPARLGLPDLGIGVGLRIPHYPAIFGEGDTPPANLPRHDGAASDPIPRAPDGPPIDWFEIISENFMVPGGLALRNLDRALERFPLVQHGVSLSIGSTEPLDWDYLKKLKALLQKVKSPWVSDHLCWTGAHGTNLHDLLPLPYTEEAVKHIAARARTVQDFLGVRLLIENASSYLTYTSSQMTEWAFLRAIVEEADLGILLDVNNIYVSSYNHGFDPLAYVDGVPHDRVAQIHLAGHTNHGKYIIDTHSAPVIDPVWELYRRTIERTGPVSTMVEWDAEIPPFATLVAEADKARVIRDEVCRARAA